MKDYSHYLLGFQYLGFRYHGWQKQPGVKTVQSMLERTLRFILKHDEFKTLAAGRTDRMVSAQKTYCMITLKKAPYLAPEELFNLLYQNLPADIHPLSIKSIGEGFNIIGRAKLKTYHYFFSNESRPLPFAAPYMCNFDEKLDIEVMQAGAKLFEGEHDFYHYCYRPHPEKIFRRTIRSCEIKKNDILLANFFPKTSYVLAVTGEGFMRHQIRLMMGALLNLGRERIKLEEIRASLEQGKAHKNELNFLAPSSGLMLADTTLN